MPTERNLRDVAGGLIVAPAGCGKTQLIHDALVGHEGTKPNLVLTHTNAGVAALRLRLDRSGVPSRSYRVQTIDGFAIKLINTFPERSGHNPRIVSQQRPNYPSIREHAWRLLAKHNLDDILPATYERLFVDEYQDCSVRQHGLISALADLVPTAIVGDDLQAIFGFDANDPLADWNSDVLARFPLQGELATPWRWINAGTRKFGEWLLSVRKDLIRGIPIDLREAPPEVEWAKLDGRNNDAVRVQAASVAVGPDEKVLIIGDSRSPRDQRAFARKVPGAVTVEAVDLRDLTEFGESFDVTSRNALPAVAMFAENLMSAFGGQDLVQAVARILRGELARMPTEIEQRAIAFANDPSFTRVSDLLAAINRAGGVRCHRPAVLAATQRALQLAAAPGGPSFREATITIREQARLVGRPLAKRSVGSTLLLKGLEADVAVILNPIELDARNLYVAMTRGSRRLIVCSADPLIKRFISA